MHKSVLLQQTIKLLNLKPGMTVIDATVGAGGHTNAILAAVGETGRVLGLDKDITALELAKKNLGGCSNLVLAHADFAEIESVANQHGFDQVDAILADIGVSSMQFDQKERGFSFSGHYRLDMRMDRSAGQTACDLIASYKESDLIRIFRDYGEEKQAKRIASEIVRIRAINPIEYTDQLAEVVRGVKKASGPQAGKIDPATKVFQALRIEVNGELKALESALPQMIGLIKPKGRIAIISFHSLEDRIVKNTFTDYARTCVCPPDYPKCICNTQPQLKIITRKPVVAEESEIKENPRSRSAKLRVAEKI